MLKICFKLNSLNTERKLNQLIKSGVDVFEVQKSGKELTFFVDKKNEKRVLEFFQGEELQNFPVGFEALIQFFKKRIGIVVGAVFFLISILVFPNLLINVNVEGNNLVQTQEIIDILEQNGYNKFNPISSIDIQSVENCLVNAFDEISFASAMVKGNTLIVRIREKPQEMQENFSPLYAEFGGVISSIKVQKGTPLVKVGDVVKLNQMLVAPFEMVAGKQVIVSPKAEVKARVFIKGQVEYDSSKNIKGRTGDCYEEREIEFLGIKSPAKTNGNSAIKIGEHEIEREEEIVKGIMPFKITRLKYFQIAEILEPNFERDKALLEKKSIYLAFEKINDNFEIKSQSTQTIQINSVYYITTYLEIEKNIAIQIDKNK